MKVKAVLAMYAALIFICGAPIKASAMAPYRAYNQVIYDQDISFYKAPAAFFPEAEYTFVEAGGLRLPSDLLVLSDQSAVYILDAGNNRIIMCDAELNPLRIIDSFEYMGEEHTFSEPGGIFENRHSGLIYVCDTRNRRIIIFDEDFNCINIHEAPEGIMLLEGMSAFEFLPHKIVVDMSGTMYVVARHVNQGLIEISPEGEFLAFVGAPPVATNAWERFLRIFMSKEQRDRMLNFVPTEFDNITMDEAGFIYAVSSTQMSQLVSRYTDQLTVREVSPVKKLNPQGTDVLRYDHFPPMGDAHFGNLPRFVDVVYLGNGVIAVLDSRSGRVFAYDGDGQFLYMFGGGAADGQARGSQLGTFRMPLVVERLGDTFLVLDHINASVTTFLPTAYGTAVEASVNAYYNGDYDAAYRYWTEILQVNGNYHQAMEGIGKILLRQDRYKEALDYFKLIDLNGTHASAAFRGYRREIVNNASGPIFISFVCVAVLALALNIRKAYKRFFNGNVLIESGGAVRVKAVKAGSLLEELRFSLFLMVRPFKGYWELKHEKRGSLRAAIIFLLAMITMILLRYQFSGFFFVSNYERDNVNLLQEMATVALQYTLWVISNWCFTSLMDGEGTMKDIAIATGYALMPMILINLPLIFATNFLTLEEGAFIYTLQGVGVVWTGFLLFASVLVTHQYTVPNTLIVIILTLVGLLVLLFLSLLVVTLVQQIVVFIMHMYREAGLRWM